MTVKDIKIADYDYPLPEERIALHPLRQRDSCKLLVAGAGDRISHRVFSSLPLLLKKDSLVVANETKVIRARMEFLKDTGARIEIFLLEPMKPHDYVTNFASDGQCSWVCLVGNKKRWKEGALVKTLEMGAGLPPVELRAELGEELPGNGMEVSFSWSDSRFSFAEIVEKVGNIPIPPYLKRASEECDSEDYQTVFSRTQGSVAAPTAGLHFTPELISELKRHGDEFATVTLHVGAGTFQPVKSEDIGGHPMHTEWFSVSRSTLLRLISALENGRDIVAVGTTSVRVLESLPYIGLALAKDEQRFSVSQWEAYDEDKKVFDTVRTLRNILDYMRQKGLDSIEGETSIMIAPGFRWRLVKRLVTNFHQPKSTLLLLVSSFLGLDPDGKERWRRVYDEALDNGYRFLSYGDACLFSRGRQSVLLPPTKSMALRAAMICAVKYPGATELLQPLGEGCDDTFHFVKALQKVWASKGNGRPGDIYIGEGAAPLRFLVAYAASFSGCNVRITAAEGLRKRPVLPLIEALRSIGADIDFNDDFDDWSIAIRGGVLKGGEVAVDASFTSQYLSALLLASPLWCEPLKLPDDFILKVSRPYFRMTEVMMEKGIVRPEPDWSAAAFFYEYALISGEPVILEALTPPAASLQGDAACCDIYSMLGINTRFNTDGSAVLHLDENSVYIDCSVPLSGETPENLPVFEYDFTDFPDMVPSVAVALCYRRIPFRFHGVRHLRFKECDRLSVLQKLLTMVGFEVEANEDTLVFNGVFSPGESFPVEIDPHGDHRMAMAFYPLELKGMVTVEDKGVVSKSFPDFYQQF